MKKKSIYILLVLVVVGIISLIFINFKTNSYTVNFYNEGALFQSIEVRKNKAIKEPNPPIKEGYMFIGWYLNNELYNFDSETKENLNLVAGWGKISTEE